MEKKWDADIDRNITSSPEADDNLVTAVTDDKLWVLGFSDGDTIRTVRLDSRATSISGVLDGVVYVGTSEGLRSVDIYEGEINWEFDTKDRVESVPVTYHGNIYFGSHDDNLYSLNADNGKLEWRFTTDGSVKSTPTVSDSSVYFGSYDKKVYSLDTSTGEKNWEFETGASVSSSPIVSDGTLFVGSHDRHVYALDAETGERRWKFKTGGGMSSSPVVSGGLVYAGSWGGHLYALSVNKGDRKWSFETGGRIAVSPIVTSGGNVFVGSYDGNVYMISSDGELEWSYNTGSRIDNSPTVSHGRLYFSSGSKVYAFRYRKPETDDNDGDRTEEDTESVEEVSATGDADDIKEEGEPIEEVSVTNDVNEKEIIKSLDIELGDIERKKIIGSGGNADVHLANISTDEVEKTVALKTPRMSNYETVDESFFEKFVREAETWSKIDNHENIITVMDWGKGAYPWIALEYMSGGNLLSNPPSSVEKSLETIIKIADATQYAHRHGVAHGDLKPENILLKGDFESVKVGDWGLAKVLLDHSRSTDGLSPAYAAPEQFKNKDRDAVGYQLTDIYQLGAVAYEVFTGEPPFDGPPFEIMDKIQNEMPQDPIEVNPELPEEAGEIVLKSMSKDPDDRFETAVQFRNAVRSVEI